MLGVLFVLLASAVVASFFYKGKSELAVRLETKKAAGEPTSWAEMDARIPAVPDAENAALAFVACAKGKAFGVSRETMAPYVGVNCDPGKSSKWPERWLADSLGYLTTHADTLACIHDALRLPGARFAVIADGGRAEIPVAEMRQLSNILRLASEYQAEIGDASSCVEQLHASIRLTAITQTIPQSPGVSFSFAQQMTTVSALESVLSRVALDETQLARLNEDFQSIRPTIDMMDRLLHGLDCNMLDYRANPDDHERGVLGSMMIARGSASVMELNASFREKLRLAPAERAAALDALFESMRMRRNRPDVVDGPWGLLDNLASGGWPRYDITISAYSQTLTANTLAKTAIAIERYRLRHEGVYPESLADLVPDLLPAIPIDDHDGSPIEYTKSDDGYVITSAKAKGEKKLAAPGSTQPYLALEIARGAWLQSEREPAEMTPTEDATAESAPTQ